MEQFSLLAFLVNIQYCLLHSKNMPLLTYLQQFHDRNNREATQTYPLLSNKEGIRLKKIIIKLMLSGQKYKVPGLSIYLEGTGRTETG